MKKITSCFMLSAFIALFFSGCGGGQSADPLFQTILLNEEGHLRGSSIGDPMQEVEKREDKRGMQESENEYLYYEFYFSADESYTVTYNFYENRLIEIIVAVYINTEEDMNKIFNAFTNRFNNLYGKSHLEDDGFWVWNTTSPDKHNVEVAMIKEFEQGSYGYVEVRVNDLDY